MSSVRAYVGAQATTFFLDSKDSVYTSPLESSWALPIHSNVPLREHQRHYSISVDYLYCCLAESAFESAEVVLPLTAYVTSKLLARGVIHGPRKLPILTVIEFDTFSRLAKYSKEPYAQLQPPTLDASRTIDISITDRLGNTLSSGIIDTHNFVIGLRLIPCW